MTGYIVHGGPVPIRSDDPRSAVEALERAAQLAPRAGVGVIDDSGQRLITYPRFLERARRLSAGLRAAGICDGNPVILQLSDVHDHLQAVWGCVLAGVRPVVLTVPHTAPAQRARLTHVWRELGEPPILADTADDLPDRATVLEHEKLLATPPDDVAAARVDGPLLYLLSSGSTGAPKIIGVTERGLVELAVSARQSLGIEPGHSTFNWMPLDHSGAFLLYHMSGVFLAVTNWHSTTDWVLREPLRWLTTLTDLDIQHSWAPNFAYRLAAEVLSTDHPGGVDLSRVKTLVSGGEQIQEPVMTDFLERTRDLGMSADRFRPCWGMTETTTAIAFGRYDHRDAIVTIGDRRLVSVGEPHPGAEFRVVDADGTTLPEGEIGVLQVRSARITPGYVGQDAPPVDGQGWFDTGDLAHLGGGRLTITGRQKDLIILNGQNHDCHRIEEVAATVPGVRAGLIGAVGVGDAARGSESLGIALVTDGEPGEIAAGVRRVVAQELGLTAAIVAVVEAERFPLTGSGKIQRSAIRDRLTTGEWRDSVDTATAATDLHGLHATVVGVFAAVLGFTPHTDRPLYEQGVDSVAIPRLSERLSRVLNRPVTTTTLLRHPHIDALVAALTGERPTGYRSPRNRTDDRVAIIGMAARFPGADSIDRFWENLCAGRESLRRFTPEELAAAGIPAARYGRPNFVPVTGSLGEGDPETIAEFDAVLFGISAAEAVYIDPQQRLFLEICHQALETAGYSGEGDDRVGLYAGCGMNLYAGHSYLQSQLVGAGEDPLAAMRIAMGNQPDFLATRVAHRLGLTGPAVTVQTACSTSLVAVHQATAALIAGEADIAVAGAASLHVPAITGYSQVDGTMLSPTGQCRSFDAAADGTVGGNGVACVVLKPLERAIADGDTIHGVLLGSAVNNDGASKVGFTAPSVTGQVAAITAALDSAAVPADSIGYVEAHGTGTVLGDPMEVQALTEAFAARSSADTECVLGSVKANVGHLDACAGMAGLIKAVLVLRDGKIPPQINFERWNPAIDPGPFRVHTELTDWPTGEHPRRASVQALGVGGTNAHLVLEQPPTDATTTRTATGGVVLSAHTPEALRELSTAMIHRLRRPNPPHPGDVFTSSALGRRHRPHRMVAFADTAAELAEALESGPVTGVAGRPGPVAMTFGGLGDLPNLSDLYDASPGMRNVVDRCVAAVEDELGLDLSPTLFDPAHRGTDEVLAQAALFTVQSGLFALWTEWGLRPDYVAGHGVGEYAAWCAAGAFNVEDGARLAAVRGESMSRLCAPGAMLAVRTDRRTVEAIRTVTELDTAAINGPREYVLSGTAAAVEAAEELLDHRGCATVRLPVRRAFHSRSMEPLLPRLAESISKMDFTPTRRPVVAGVDGRIRPPGSTCGAAYLIQHTRQPVRWDRVVERLHGIESVQVLELGCDDTLSRIGRRTAPGIGWISAPGTATATRDAAARLYCDGHDIDWRTLSAGGRRIPLPTHPFHRARHWITRPNETEPT